MNCIFNVEYTINGNIYIVLKKINTYALNVKIINFLKCNYRPFSTETVKGQAILNRGFNHPPTIKRFGYKTFMTGGVCWKLSIRVNLLKTSK